MKNIFSIVINGLVALQSTAVVYFILFAAAGGIQNKEPRWFLMCLNVALVLIPALVIGFQTSRLISKKGDKKGTRG